MVDLCMLFKHTDILHCLWKKESHTFSFITMRTPLVTIHPEKPLLWGHMLCVALRSLDGGTFLPNGVTRHGQKGDNSENGALWEAMLIIILIIMNKRNFRTAPKIGLQWELFSLFKLVLYEIYIHIQMSVENTLKDKFWWFSLLNYFSCEQ